MLKLTTSKSDIHKQLSENFKLKAGTLTQQVQDRRYEFEGTRDKENEEVDNLKYLLNVDATKKETLENRLEKLENIVVDLEYDCAKATEELAVSLVVENILSCYVLLYLPNV